MTTSKADHYYALTLESGGIVTPLLISFMKEATLEMLIRGDQDRKKHLKHGGNTLKGNFFYKAKGALPKQKGIFFVIIVNLVGTLPQCPRFLRLCKYSALIFMILKLFFTCFTVMKTCAFSSDFRTLPPTPFILDTSCIRTRKWFRPLRLSQTHTQD